MQTLRDARQPCNVNPSPSSLGGYGVLYSYATFGPTGNPLAADGIVCACNFDAFSAHTSLGLCWDFGLQYVVWSRILRPEPTSCFVTLVSIYITHKEAPNSNCDGCDFAFRLTGR